LCLSGRA
jgi:hypothetical protein